MVRNSKQYNKGYYVFQCVIKSKEKGCIHKGVYFKKSFLGEVNKVPQRRSHLDGMKQSDMRS